MPLTTRQKILIIGSLVAIAMVLIPVCLWQQATVKPQLVIYGPRGISDLGYAAAQSFSKKYGINATFVHFGMGSIEIVQKAIEESKDPKADVILAIPEFYATPIIEKGVLEKYAPSNIREISETKIWDRTGHVTPLDEAPIIIIYNSTMLEKLKLPAPETLDDLTRPEYKGLVVYNSPVTSGTGLSVLTWVLTEKGENEGFDYLLRLKANIAPVGYPSGFSSLVTVLRTGRAAIVVSFNSHVVDPQTPHMKTKGTTGFMYREGMALVKGAKNAEAAKKFIEFMISKEGQDLVDPNNYMYPIRDDAVVTNLKNAPRPLKTVTYNWALGGRADVWREKWRTQIAGA
jgi:thiamine transport system substrate-binding protein